MEENNSNSIFKVTVIVAMAVILGVNVYRTEQCKKEINNLSKLVEGHIMYHAISDSTEAPPLPIDMTDASAINSEEPGNSVVIEQGISKESFEKLSKSVSLLESKVAALQGKVQTPAGNTTVVQGASKEEVTKLTSSISSMESRITALQSKVELLAQNQKKIASTIQKTTSTSSSSSSSTKTVSSSSKSTSVESISSSQSDSRKVRVSVTAKVKVEDRYVRDETYLPKISEGIAGKVVVGIYINHTGEVISARIKPESTISDEYILDACKDAALRTKFSFNFEVSNKHPGTITYTFTAR